MIANIRRNAATAIPAKLQPMYCVEGHIWGEIDSDFASANAHAFDRVIAADCYWMPGEHVNLVHSMLHFLTHDPGGRVFICAGFHTGRAKLASFFDIAAERGLEVEEIYEEDAAGLRREWDKERDGGREDHTERKKWLVIAMLRRKVRSDVEQSDDMASFFGASTARPGYPPWTVSLAAP